MRGTPHPNPILELRPRTLVELELLATVAPESLVIEPKQGCSFALQHLAVAVVIEQLEGDWEEVGLSLQTIHF